MSSYKRFIFYYLPPILWGLAIFISSTIPGKSLPSIDIWDWDKFAHLCVNFVFAFLLYRAFLKKRLAPSREWFRVIFVVCFIAVFAATDEYHQLFVPGRNCDVFDWMSDTMGGVLFALFHWVYFKTLGKRGSAVAV